MLDANDFSQELTFIMIKRALLLLLLTAVWAFGSWWYYTCMIKGFCRADGAFTSAADRAKTIATTGAAAVAVTATGLVNDEQATPEPLETEPTTEATEASDQTATPSTTSEFIDQDNDAISDEDERRLGTNPASDDSDGDGLKDNEELGADLLNPTDTDKDGIIDALDEDDDNDTLPTLQERTIGTDPRNADSDDDALSDADEVSNEKIGTNPLLADTDKDGISDGSEVGSEPSNPMDTDKDGIIDALDEDDDNDGIPTAIEIKANSDPMSQDSDGDGISDSEELGDNPDQPKDTDGDGIFDIIDSENGVDAPATTEEAAAEPVKADASSAAPEQTPTTAPSSDDQVTINTPESTGDNASGITIQKSRLYFPSRSSNPGLSEAATNYFKEVASWLNTDDSHRVTLTGHTDSVGKAKNNLDLGLKRAIEIKDMMVKLGANESQIDVGSMGETQPIASNKTDSGRRQNRRVELIPALKQ
jgi:outer membrane protein OmpA-like peptidoglycan-associated protein